MYYLGYLTNIDEYYEKRMNEIKADKNADNFSEETEYNIIAEYVSFCGIEKEEADFIYKHGFTVWDFVYNDNLPEDERKHLEILEKFIEEENENDK